MIDLILYLIVFGCFAVFVGSVSFFVFLVDTAIETKDKQ